MEIGVPSYKGIKRYQDGDNAALRKVILNVTPKAAEQMCEYAQRFRGKDDLETCRNIWNFLKTKIKYVADQEYQIVRLPSALLKTKEGDCKSYSVFTSAILQCLGIPHHYMMTSYNKSNPTPSHIYVMTDSGIIIDAVWHSFNSEKPYAYVYKIKPYKTMKTNTGLGGTAIPPFKVGMGAIPSFQGKGSAVPMISNVGMGSSCGCGCGMGSCACGCQGCGMGAISKTQVNAPMRTMILLFFKLNIGGLATKFQNAGIGDDKLGRWFTNLGGDGRELWAAIKEGSSKPVIAKWFSNSIKNLTIRQLRNQAGITGDDTTDPKTETTEEANNTPYVNYEDIIAVMSSTDKQSRLKALFTILGGGIAQLIPACAADPTGVVKTACALGGGAIGYALQSIYNEIVRALFPKPASPPRLEWSSLKPMIDKIIVLQDTKIDATGLAVCNKFPKMFYNGFRCSIMATGKTIYDDELVSDALMNLYLNAGAVSKTLQSQMVEYLRAAKKGMGVVSFYDKAQAEANKPLKDVSESGGALQQAGAGIGIALVGVIALLALSAGKKGIKGKR